MSQKLKIIALGLLLFSMVNGGCAWLGRQISPGAPLSLKVGFIVSSASKGEESAQAFEQGLKLAIAEINANREPGQPEISLIGERIRKRNPAEVIKLGLKMEKKEVSALFCFLSAAEAKALFPLANRFKIPVFVESEISSFPSSIYSLSPYEKLKGASLARFALNTLKKRKAAIFYSRGDRIQREKAYSFEKFFRKEKGEVVLVRPYPLAAPEAVFKELNLSEPEVFFLSLNSNDEKLLLKDLRKKLKIKADFLFGRDLSKKEAKIAPGGYFVRFYPFFLFELSGFSQKYAQKFKSNPSPASFSAYLALHLLNRAVVKAKTAEGNLLSDYLEGVKVEKEGGQYWFGKERFLKGPAYFYQLRGGGEIILVKAEPLSF